MGLIPHRENLACPKCGHDGFHVDITGTAYIGKAGAEVLDDCHWDHRSTCTCLQCCFESRLGASIKRKEVQS